MTKCPHCEHEIDHLRYHESGSYNSWGQCDLDGGNADQDDSNMYCSETTYECPDCNNPINPDDLVEIDDEEEETEEETPPVESTKVVLEGDNLIQTDKGRTIYGVRCASCHTTTLIDEGETGVLCHKCGEEIDCTTRIRM